MPTKSVKLLFLSLLPPIFVLQLISALIGDYASIISLTPPALWLILAYNRPDQTEAIAVFVRDRWVLHGEEISGVFDAAVFTFALAIALFVFVGIWQFNLWLLVSWIGTVAALAFILTAGFLLLPLAHLRRLRAHCQGRWWRQAQKPWFWVRALLAGSMATVVVLFFAHTIIDWPVWSFTALAFWLASILTAFYAIPERSTRQEIVATQNFLGMERTRTALVPAGKPGIVPLLHEEIMRFVHPLTQLMQSMQKDLGHSLRQLGAEVTAMRAENNQREQRQSETVAELKTTVHVLQKKIADIESEMRATDKKMEAAAAREVQKRAASPDLGYSAIINAEKYAEAIAQNLKGGRKTS